MKIQIHIIESIVIIAVFALIGCNKTELYNEKVSLIPQPSSLVERSGPAFSFGANETIYVSDSSLLFSANRLNEITGKSYKIEISTEGSKGRIYLGGTENTEQIPTEGYKMGIDANQLKIEASSKIGIFYGIETVRQLLSKNKKLLPSIEISDQPRFGWRGMHLDVSRHFMPVDFIKKFIDQMAIHKLNTFHWHLVDGIGWRIEIKSHPELTDQGAWRIVKENKRPWQEYETWKPGDDRTKYGGYYTQEEIKEVIKYASERQITIVPEIELPGHSQVVFDVYPDLICKDEKGNPLTNAGVYCVDNPNSYELLEDVIAEVIELFPSEYIHIGGDEVGKGNWEKCAGCKRLMRENDYTSHELQSHFVNHFDEFIKDKGRRLIGWHEILEGELSPSATIMFWGGANGITNYTRRGHDMVLSPGSHLYFDHYQSLSGFEPKAFGGYSSLRKVYEFNPVPSELENQFKENILGIQANLWTEYMPEPKNVEYMAFPRMAALAEVAWNVNTEKDWSAFREKLEPLISLYDELDINYSKSSYRPQISFELDTTTREVNVIIETEVPSEIYYTIDGNEPTIESSVHYNEPIKLKSSAVVKSISAKNGSIQTEVETLEAKLHKARGAEVQLTAEGYGKYAAKSGFTLVDTEFGGDKWGNGKWLGILDQDLEAVVEFDSPIDISNVGLSCIEETAAGIYFPAKIEIWTSVDGENYTSVKSISNTRDKPIQRTSEIYTRIFELEFDPVRGKFLKILATYEDQDNQGVFIFADELIVN